MDVAVMAQDKNAITTIAKYVHNQVIMHHIISAGKWRIQTK